MEKRSHSQLELFTESGDSGQMKAQARNAFFDYVRAYEKAILTIIGVMIICIVSFSLGVAKGKRMARLRQDAPSIIINSQRVSSQKIGAQTAIIIKPVTGPAQVKGVKDFKETVSLQPSIQSNGQKYTIQVASYQNKAHAQKEVERLNKKGLSATVLPKGKYNIVCVGSFLTKETANKLISEIKTQYQDCYIRRL